MRTYEEIISDDSDSKELAEAAQKFFVLYGQAMFVTLRHAQFQSYKEEDLNSAWAEVGKQLCIIVDAAE